MGKFIKGQSGNPGGRPREIGDVRALARERTEKALLTLERVMDDMSAPPSARVAAANALLDRGYGKPTTIIENQSDAPEISIDEAARRIAFALNTAVRNGKVFDGEFAEILPKLLD